ncbi:MAG: chitinase, partial [Lachnospiraceae bacterium]
AHYNRKEQGIVADYVIIMGYDEHYGGGGVAGSVASIDFVEEGIQKTMEEVAPEKIINAIPFYTRVWKTVGADVTSENVAMGVGEAFLAKN